MQISTIDVETLVLQRDLEIRRLLRTDYRAARNLAGEPAERRTMRQRVSSAFGRLRASEQV
jgi:hypothetical protein